MAEGRRIRVCVLEGNYVELAEAGAPIPVCLQMQQLELSLGKAQWSTRQTCGGFSVSFFWPMSPAKSARNVSTRKKRKRRRKSTKRTDEGTRCLVASSERTQGDKPDVLINDHPAGSNTNADSESKGVSSPADSESEGVSSPADNESKGVSSPADGESEGVSSPELDLAALNDVVYEEQEGEPGVKYTSESGEASWTPMVNRRSRKRKVQLTDPGFDGACSGDQVNELQSTIQSARDVTFQCREGVPGLRIQKGCMLSSISWMPIAATPVASRTRSKARLS